MTGAKESHEKQPHVMTNQVAIENDIPYLLTKYGVQGRGERLHRHVEERPALLRVVDLVHAPSALERRRCVPRLEE